MKESFVRRQPRDFFNDKKAIVLVEQSNIGGETISKDDIVTITGKNTIYKTCLNIRSSSGVEIYRVSCEYLELIK